MTALPGATTKVFLDSADDDPKQARTELVDMLDKFNTMRDYLSGLFGTDGTAATARTNLNVQANFSAGIEMIFGDSTLDSGWSHNTSRNDEVVRIVSGAGNSSGGSASISGGTVPAVTASALTIAQLAVHDHLQDDPDADEAFGGGGAGVHTPATSQTGPAGSGSTHPHASGSYDIKHRDYVSATKD